MKTTIKNVVFLIFLWSMLFITGAYAQEVQPEVNISIGWKAGEVSYTLKNEDFLNFGIAISATDTEMVEKRADRNDRPKRHDFKGDYLPTVYGMVGATFDGLTITGKAGVTYGEQTINKIPDSKKYWLAVGIRFEYKQISLSYDNPNSLMVGYTFKL